MIIEFSVKNFLSFKNKVTFSMEKGNGIEKEDNYVLFDDDEILKTAAIYGANASGKSNFLKAFTCAILIFRQSSLIPAGYKWINVKPFLFDENCNNSPSEFEFVVLINSIKYKYYFSVDKEKIYDEVLDVYYSQKPTNIFTRRNTNNYVFNSDKSFLEDIKTKTSDNKLFLATLDVWNYEKIKDLSSWFFNGIDTYDSFNYIADFDLKEYSNNEELKDFALKLLKEADILVKDIEVSYEENDVINTMVNIPVNPFKIKNVKIKVVHEIVENDKPKYFTTEYGDESSGTRILFSLAPHLKRAFEKNKVIIVDELERSLHPTLVEFIVKLFNNPKINKANSQLIFSTHATNLLSLELFRRDQIWFTEKDPQNGISDLYPLDSFSVRKDENILKGYINGRYGAIPFIRDDYLWLEDLKK